MQKKTRAATQSLGLLAIIGGILVALNVLGVFFSARLDATEKELFSLSKGSKRLAKSLTDKLEVTAYFTEDLPPPFNATERYVRDILTEYASASGGKIHITFINPDTDEEKEKAREDGIAPVSHQVVENDSIAVKEGYRGLVLRYLDREEKVPVIQDTAGLEYLLTMKLKKLVGDRTTIGVLGGHEGPELAKGLATLQTCLPTYDMREVQASEDIPGDLSALLIVGPATAFGDDELRRINKYVMGGGSLAVLGADL
ncbi:MAG: GldG family protein, partial [Myxococcales bacterium]|nr:GldG family protein [Myxococcales bacterium]